MLPRIAEKKYDTDLKISVINDNKKFWKGLRPILRNKKQGK